MIPYQIRLINNCFIFIGPLCYGEVAKFLMSLTWRGVMNHTHILESEIRSVKWQGPRISFFNEQPNLPYPSKPWRWGMQNQTSIWRQKLEAKLVDEGLRRCRIRSYLDGSSSFNIWVESYSSSRLNWWKLCGNSGSQRMSKKSNTVANGRRWPCAGMSRNLHRGWHEMVTWEELVVGWALKLQSVVWSMQGQR